MRYLILFLAVAMSGCTFVKINQGDGGGDAFVDTPYKSRAAITDSSGGGDIDADVSGDTEGGELGLEIPLP